jgi:hypothetical protein
MVSSDFVLLILAIPSEGPMMDGKMAKVHSGSNMINGEVTIRTVSILVLRSVVAPGMRIFRISAVRRIESGFRYSDVGDCRYVPRGREDS